MTESIPLELVWLSSEFPDTTQAAVPSLETLAAAYTYWCSTNKRLRFGQYFMSTYMPTLVNPAIFYEINPKAAYDKLQEIINA